MLANLLDRVWPFIGFVKKTTSIVNYTKVRDNVLLSFHQVTSEQKKKTDLAKQNLKSLLSKAYAGLS